ADPIFLRVGMFLWGMPFLTAGGISLAYWRPAEAYEWIGLALLSVIGCGGAFLMYVAVRGTKHSVDKAADFMSEGSDFVGVLFALTVFLLALPITACFRALATPSKQ
ncbi:MAG TPA: hypothetical protein VIU63_05360, partial [Nitrospira sp.]